MSRSAAGNTTAFAEVYRLTSPRIYGLVLRVLRSRDHACEVTQEVYLEVWRQAARYNPAKGSVLTWMSTIAHRRAVDRVRSVCTATARDRNYLARTCSREIDDVWDSVSSRADAASLHAAVSRLSPIQQQAMTLAYLDGHTQAQIATLLGLPLGTVKTRIRNGLITLRRQMHTS